jgi:dTDP-4-dehydrorhamnose reductase
MDLRAVTIWSMFGNVDWRFLLTQKKGFYDTGAFDVRGGTPRPTIIAKAAKALAHARRSTIRCWIRPAGGGVRAALPLEQLLQADGMGRAQAAHHRRDRHARQRFRPDLRGSGASLLPDEPRRARHLRRSFDRRRDREAQALGDHQHGRIRPSGRCGAGEGRLASRRTRGPEKLARACADAGIKLVTFSSDLVFDGQLGRAYRENDEVCPANVYGLSKAKAEQEVLGALDEALVIRTSAFFGPWDKYNFAWNTLSALARGEPVEAGRNTSVSPTYVPDLCHATLDLLVDGEKGIWHLANQGKLSWYEFATQMAECAGYDPSLVTPIEDVPANTALTSARGIMLRPVEHAIDDYLGAIGERKDKLSELQIAAE